MLGRISSLLIAGCAATAAALVGLSCAPQANAQPYSDDSGAYAAPDYGQDTSATVGGFTVTPNYREGEAENGIPTQRVYASQVVPIDDLDLSTRWGVHELRARVAHAASNVCRRLDEQWPQGLYPVDSNDGDCKARAIRHAMADAPITYDGDDSYYDNGY